MKNLFALVFVLSSLCFVNLEAQNIINGPGKLLINADNGINEHLQIVPASELSENDVWQFEEVEDGNVILKCPTRGYLVSGIGHDNIFELSYHQYAKTATRFNPHTKADGYKVYEWVSSNSLHKNRYIGGWRNTIVLKLNSPVLLKIVPSPGKLLLNTGQGINEHLKIVPASELSENDVWQFEEVEDGNVILKCPTRGYLVSGIGHDNIFELSYHQYAKTATRFKPHTKADGYKVYEWVSSNSLHKNRYIGGWRNTIVLKLNSPVLLKIE